MTPVIDRKIFKVSGSCIVIGSTLLTIGYWLRPYIEKQFVLDFTGTAALYSSVLVAAGILMLLTGLPALFYQQIKHTNSFIPFALTFTGLAAFHLGTLSLYFVLPVLATHSVATFELIAQDVPPFPRFAIFWALSLLIQVVGMIIYGVKMLKAKTYPRVATVAIIIGAIVLISSPAINFRFLQPGVTVMMIGFAMYGITLLKRNTACREVNIPADAAKI